MPNDLIINLKLNDRASKSLSQVQTKLQRFSVSFKKNWLQITAAITASIVAINKAVDLIKLSAKVKQQEQAFRELSASFGANADSIISDLKKMSGETLSTAQVMQNASKAMILGLAPDQLPKLMEISRASARAFGEDVDFMFDSIVLGIGRQSKMILDNLGIIVSVDQANKEYAETMGIVGRSLTESEKKQAFLNATLKAGDNILNTINTSQKSQLENLQSLGAFWEDLRVKVGNVLLALIQIVGAFVNAARSGMASVIASISSAVTMLLEKLNFIVEKTNELVSKLPFVNEPLNNISLKLEELAFNTEAFTQSMNQGADEFAEAAVMIADLMESKPIQSSQRLRDAVNEVNTSIENTGTTAKVEGAKISNSIGNALGSAVASGNNFAQSMASSFKSWAATAVAEITKVIIKLTVMDKVMKSIGGGGGFFGAILGAIFSQGGIVGGGGTKMPLPMAAQGAMIGGGVGRAVPVIAHEGEVIGTPDKLASSGMMGNGITINVNSPIISSTEDIENLAETLGFETENAIRTARGI